MALMGDGNGMINAVKGYFDFNNSASFAFFEGDK